MESDVPIRSSALYMQNRSAIQDSDAASQDSDAFDLRENMRDKYKIQEVDRAGEQQGSMREHYRAAHGGSRCKLEMAPLASA